MSDEPLHKTVYRRVRKHVGEKWSPDTRNSPNIAIGPWCPHCRAIHAWRSKEALGIGFEKRSGIWYTMWICNKTGNVIRERGM